MKKILLALSLVSVCVPSYAQPTLTAATNNPVPGDKYFGHFCDSVGPSPGAAGASVTWDFSWVTYFGTDTTTYFPCPTTGMHCDSFPTGNIASTNSGDNYYHLADATKFAMVGIEITSFPVFIHINPGTFDHMFYPMTMGSTHNNSFEANVFGSYMRQLDTFIVDGYGTLMLPTGTYTNVLRVHNKSISRDSSFSGSGWDVTTWQTDIYNWYTAGFHSPLFTFTVDTATVNSGVYYTNALTLTSNHITNKKAQMTVSPNPASDAFTIKVNIADAKDASIVISDMLGRTAGTISSDQIHNGVNEFSFPVTTLANGVYVVRLHSPRGDVSQKVVVSK